MKQNYRLTMGFLAAAVVITLLALRSPSAVPPPAVQEDPACCKKTPETCSESQPPREGMIMDNLSRQFISVSQLIY